MSSRKTDYGPRQNRDWGGRHWTDSEDRRTERSAPGNGLAKDSYQRYAGEASTRKRQDSRNLHYRNSSDRNYGEEPLKRDRRSGSPGRSRYAAVTPKQNYDREKGSAEQSEDDQELARKKNELRMIKEQIAYKRAAIEQETSKTSISTKQQGPARKYRRFTEGVEEDFTYPVPSNYDVNMPVEDKNIRKVDVWPQEYTSSSQVRSRSPDVLQPVLQMGRVDRVDNCFVREHRKDSHRQDIEGHSQSQSMRAPTFQPNKKDHDDVFDATSRRRAPQCVAKSAAGEGFQRFLSVLNKGVDLDMLNRIANNVNQGATGGRLPYRQNVPLENYPPHSGGVPQGSRGSCGSSQRAHDTRSDSEERGTYRPTQEAVPMDLLVGNELPCQDKDIDHRTDTSRFDKVSMSRVLEETKIARPEDVQVQNVLQAIGLELGVDELGQLSNRIQERLYGKKREGVIKEGDKDKHSKRDSLTRRDSRSSSSSSSCVSPCHSLIKASSDASRKHTELNFKSSLDCDTECQDNSVAAYPFPQNPVFPTSYSLPPMMPTYTLYPAYQSTPPVLENPIFPSVSTLSSFPSAASQHSYTEPKRQLTYITLQTDSDNLSQRYRCLKTVETETNGS